VLWPGNSGPQSAERRLLCGLQLLGPNGRPIPFKGKVAEQDQSKVWPVGTCLSIDAATNQPTDIPVDCAAPHAAEITGTVNLADRFPGGPPAQPDQDAFITEVCMRITVTYLAPDTLRGTGMTLHYSAVTPASWSAGSRQVACRIGMVRDDQSWATLTGSARRQPTANIEAPPAEPPPPPPSPEPAAATPQTTAPAPASTVSPAATTAPSTSPAVSAASTTSAPPPPPPPESPATTSETPGPPVIEIPGLPPITLPVFPLPAEPPPPAA